MPRCNEHKQRDFHILFYPTVSVVSGIGSGSLEKDDAFRGLSTNGWACVYDSPGRLEA